MAEQRFQAPDGWRWGTMKNADGARLRYGWVDPPGGARGAVVLAPSFQSTSEQYFETARELVRAGFAVWILDRRGQGGSDGWPNARRRAHLEGVTREVRDLRQFADLAADHETGRPLFLVGESLGGVIGLHLLHDDPGRFSAAAFSSPGINFQTGGTPRWLARVATYSQSVLGMKAAYAPGQHDWRFNPLAGGPSDPAKDEPDRALAAQAFLQLHPSQIEDGPTNGFVRSLFEEADLEQSAGWATAIRTPFLIGFTPLDQIADPSAIQAFCKAAKPCQLERFDGARHALFSDSDPTRSRWLASLINFLGAETATRPA
jgi:lysophospholipase